MDKYKKYISAGILPFLVYIINFLRYSFGGQYEPKLFLLSFQAWKWSIKKHFANESKTVDTFIKKVCVKNIKSRPPHLPK